MKKKQPALPTPAADDDDEDEKTEFKNSSNGHVAESSARTPLQQEAAKSSDSGNLTRQQRVAKQPIGPPRLATASRARSAPPPPVVASTQPRPSFASAALRKPSANQNVSAISAARRDRAATAVAAKPPVPGVAVKRPRPTASTTATTSLSTSVSRAPVTNKENRLARGNAAAPPVQHITKPAIVVEPPTAEIVEQQPAIAEEVALVAQVESTPKRARRAIDTPMKRLFDQAAATKAPTTPPMEQKVNRAMTFDQVDAGGE